MKEIVEENSQKSDCETPPRTPRWVKMFGVIGLLLVLLFIILHLTGHSPFMHHTANMNGMKM